MNEIAEYIKKTRILRGLSVRSVAAECNVSPSTVSRWESGEINNMGRDKIILLAHAIGIDPDILSGSAPVKELSGGQEARIKIEKATSAMDPLTGQLVRACLHLTDSQKEAVLKMIEVMTNA